MGAMETKMKMEHLSEVFTSLAIGPTTALMCWEPKKNGFFDVTRLCFNIPLCRNLLILRLSTLEEEGSLMGLGTVLGELEMGMYQNKDDGSNILA